jgi:hypothetical protein
MLRNLQTTIDSSVFAISIRTENSTVGKVFHCSVLMLKGVYNQEVQAETCGIKGVSGADPGISEDVWPGVDGDQFSG